jgi:gluconolactonase
MLRAALKTAGKLASLMSSLSRCTAAVIPVALVLFAALPSPGCGSDEPDGEPAPGGSGTSGGSGGTTTPGGAAGTGGRSGGSTGVWKCPEGLSGRPTLSGKTAERIASVPPADDFNMNNGSFGNIEGPVWIDDALYVTEMSSRSYEGLGSEVKMARILRLGAAETVTVFIADSGSNGLATDGAGNIVAAVHKDGSITSFALSGGGATPLATSYMNARFNSPNDLAIRSDGNIYFSDPTYQAPSSRPQTMTRAYRRAPDGTVTALVDSLGNPNGVTLSLDEDFLYVAASSGKRFALMADGSAGPAQDYAPASGADGMVIDCAGNLYVAKSRAVEVYDPMGNSIGAISVSDVQSVTNLAFGGADRKTLYITGLGNNKGLFKVSLDIPGRPY